MKTAIIIGIIIIGIVLLRFISKKNADKKKLETVMKKLTITELVDNYNKKQGLKKLNRTDNSGKLFNVKSLVFCWRFWTAVFFKVPLILRQSPVCGLVAIINFKTIAVTGQSCKK